MRYVIGGVAVLFLVLIVIFSIQNFALVSVDFLLWSLQLPMVVLILVTYLLGMFTGGSLWHLIKYVWKTEIVKKEPK